MLLKCRAVNTWEATSLVGGHLTPEKRRYFAILTYFSKIYFFSSEYPKIFAVSAASCLLTRQTFFKVEKNKLVLNRKLTCFLFPRKICGRVSSAIHDCHFYLGFLNFEKRFFSQNFVFSHPFSLFFPFACSYFWVLFSSG